MKLKSVDNMRRALILLLLLVTLQQSCLLAQNDTTLRFREDGTFWIAQFTDLHLDPSSPGKAQTLTILREIITREQPDLVVLTGDVVTRAPAAEGWRSIIRFFTEERQPYVVLLGNHDAETIAKDSIYTLLEGTPYCLSKRGPVEISGRGNQQLRIRGSRENTTGALLYLIDSGQYYHDQSLSHYDIIHYDQIEWLRRVHTETQEEIGDDTLPALLFFHIPVPEYSALSDNKEVVGEMRWHVNSPAINSGLFSTMLEMKGVMGAFCGHDHSNDAIGLYKGLALGYGRVSGIDAYEGLSRGGRIIVLYEGEQRFDTYVVISGEEERGPLFRYTR